MADAGGMKRAAPGGSEGPFKKRKVRRLCALGHLLESLKHSPRRSTNTPIRTHGSKGNTNPRLQLRAGTRGSLLLVIKVKKGDVCVRP